MNNKVFFVLFVAVFISCPVFGTDFEVEIDHPEDILAGNSDSIEVTIENHGNTDWFSVSLFSTQEISNWVVKKDYTIKIPSGDAKTVNFELTPPKQARASNYVYSMIVSRSFGEVMTYNLETEVLQRVFSAGITELKLSCSQCRNVIDIDVTAENLGTDPIADVRAVVEIEDVKKSIVFGDLNPGESMVKAVSFELDKTKPGNYEVVSQLFVEGKLTDEKDKDFMIPIVRETKIDKEITHTPIGAFVTLKAMNNGNVLDKAVVKDQIEDAWWMSYLGPSPEKKEGTGWTWYATLLPNENQEIGYMVIYWPVPIVALIIIVGAVMSYLHLTGAHIKKSINKSGENLHISLQVRNLGSSLEGAVIRDLVPKNCILKKGFGTLKPIIRKTAHGTELLWRIGNIKMGEERIVNYLMSSRAKGKKVLTIPAATVRGKKNEKTVVSVSGSTTKLHVGKGQEILKLEVAE